MILPDRTELAHTLYHLEVIDSTVAAWTAHNEVSFILAFRENADLFYPLNKSSNFSW